MSLSGPVRFLGELALALALALAGVLLGLRHVARPWVVGGASMLPSLEPGDRLLVDVWSYRQRAPRPGEIALLLGPAGVPLVKRVSGALASGGHPTAGGELVYVLGDNPAASTDSREFGPIPRARFLGRVVWRYWPPSRAGPIRWSGTTPGSGLRLPER